MDAESKRRQMYGERRAALDHMSEEGNAGLRETLEIPTAEKEQERKTITRDFQESEIPGGVVCSHTAFKGIIERIFAQANNMLFQGEVDSDPQIPI